MREWIAGATAVLGVLLVLAGATLKVLGALRPSDADAPAEPVTVAEGDTVPVRRHRGFAVVRAVRRLPEADGLIAWGTILLLLAAIAAGAISFNFGVDAGNR
jgi:hypothetical protein